MATPALGDPAVYPTDEVLALHLGRSKAAFAAMLERNRAEHPDFEERWKYYNDGKSWLFNVSRRKKTLFWLSVGDRCYRTTFYFRDDARTGEALLGSPIGEELKAQYRDSGGRKSHAVTLVVKSKKDLAAYEELLAIKMALKP